MITVVKLTLSSPLDPLDITYAEGMSIVSALAVMEHKVGRDLDHNLVADIITAYALRPEKGQVEYSSCTLETVVATWNTVHI